jgi:hypothetical protein
MKVKAEVIVIVSIVIILASILYPIFAGARNYQHNRDNCGIYCPNCGYEMRKR